MPYLNSDDGTHDNPKVDALTDGAYRLWDAARHYAAKHLTDGRVPERKVARLTPNYRQQQLAELLDADMLHHGGEGCGTETCVKGEAGEFVVHDYLEWNKPASWWTAKRRRDAERQAQWRDQRKGERRE